MGLHEASECTETTQSQGEMGLMWQPELSGGPLHDFLSFCEDLEPVSTPSAAKRLACSSAMWQNMEDGRCPEPCFARLPVQQHVSGSGRAISLLLHRLSSFFCYCRKVHCSCCWISTHVRAWDVSQGLEKMHLIWLLPQLHSSGLGYVKSLLSGDGGAIAAWYFIFWDV